VSKGIGTYRRAVCTAVGIGMMAACSSTAPSPSTGLTGVVVRGPVTPVCRVDVPCDAPFSATFNIERNGRRVTQFQSDTAGQFTVFLEPGTYTVAPNSDAPVMSPSSQTKSVTVADNGMLTVVRLTFDTGIR
jgi:hypothetical protein